MTFAQYARYISGFQNSKPWTHKGMSSAYYHWAEARWAEYPDAHMLVETWRQALVLQYQCLQQGDWTRAKEATDSHADFLLTTKYETIPALIAMAMGVYMGSIPDTLQQNIE